MRRIVLACLITLAACGDEGPNGTDYSGSYPGEFYAIATSTVPAERDSLPGGNVTLTLDRSDDNRYQFSSTTDLGGSVAEIVINDAGAVSFPLFNEPESLELISSLLTGICDLSNAVATPSGSVVNNRLTITLLATGGTCDWIVGQGTEVRPTQIQLTWTGVRG